MPPRPKRVDELIERLELQAHPEGGFFKEVYRSPQHVTVQSDEGSRSAVTTIYFLLAHPDVSRWHNVEWDEVWHFYEGDPLELLTLDLTSDRLERHTLGPYGDDRAPVVVVPGGVWQAARPLSGYTLVGCTVAPGFEYRDWTLARHDVGAAEYITGAFPDFRELL